MFDQLGFRQSVSVADCNYAIWIQGMGYPVILLHGWPVTSLHWRQIVPRMVAEGFKTICIDLRGLGSSQTVGGNFEKENLAREIHEVVCSVTREERYAIIGHDWGGSVAIALAKVSARISAVIVEEEIPPGIDVVIPEPGASRYPTWHGEFHRQKPLAELLISGKEREYFSFFLRLRANLASLSEEDAQEFLKAYEDSARLPIFLEYYRTNLKDAELFKTISLNRLEIPALTLGGRFAMGLGVAECMKNLFVRSEHCQFDKSGHYPAQEEPELYSEKIVSFLSEHLQT